MIDIINGVVNDIAFAFGGSGTGTGQPPSNPAKSNTSKGGS